MMVSTESGKLMKAVRIHEFGGPEVLVYEDAPKPEAKAGEVLVRIHAAGVNPADWKTRQNLFRRGNANDLPIILGWDISGVVEQTGPDVHDFKPGDNVYGMIRFPAPGGAYAEYATAPIAHLAHKPANLSHLEAAALPLVALTAWQDLHENVGLKVGQKIFINGAAGGVGHIAVQIAKAANTIVFGTASTAKQDYLRTLGVDHPIDYNSTPFETVVQDIDVFFDTVGNAAERAFDIIKPGGIYVSVVPVFGPSEKAQTKDIKMIGHLVYPSGVQMAEISRLVEEGKLKPTIAATFPLAQAQQAHEMIQTERTSGKIVLQVTQAD